MSTPVETRKPWRAGTANPGYQPGQIVTPHITTPEVVLLADVSEFQPDIADAVYLNWSKAIVIRAAYGDAHDDKAWYGGARREDLHKGGVKFLGIYQYIVASQDVGQQADVMASIIGDLEEGSGDQKGRWLSWASEISKLLGQDPWNYSGLNFAAEHGISPVDWVADYTVNEPGVSHRLWQFTDSFTVPGVGTADCSLFHGNIDELAALGYQDPKTAVQPTTVKATPRWTSIQLNWTGGHAPEGYEVYLTDGDSPNAPAMDKVLLPPTATGYRFGHLKFHHTYTVGIWAKPGATGATPTWRTVVTR